VIIFFCFLLPPLLYILLHRFLTATRYRLLIASVLLIAFISGGAVFVVPRYSGQWPEGTQIVWAGVEAADGALNIGGVREESLVGWPNGSFAPMLKAKYSGPKKVLLEISEGRAFVFDDTKKIFLNGKTFNPGVAQKMDQLELRLNVPVIGTDTIDIFDDAGKLLTQVEIPPTNPKKDQVLSMSSMVGRKTSETSDEANRIFQVEKWAAHKRLMRAKSGVVMLLGDETEKRECELPCRLIFQWPAQRLPVIVNGDGKKLALIFLPPWRTASPLPPPDTNGKRAMVVTGSVRPGDKAFNLPLGYGPKETRMVVEYDNDENGMPVFKKGPSVTWGQTPPPIYLPKELQPLPEEEVLGTGMQVTSHLTMQVGDTPTSLALSTLSDLPSAQGILLLLLLAYAVFAVGVFLTASVIPEHTSRRLLLGLAACLWNFMAFRLLMSLRFALEPNFLDDLTVKGVTLAFVGLVLIPSLTLLWVRLRCHLMNKKLEGKERTKAFVRSLVYWFLVTEVFWIAWFAAPKLWANMQTRFLPPLRWFAILLLLLFYVLGVILILYRTDHHDPRIKGYHFVFLGPLRFDVWLSRAGKDLWADMAHKPINNWGQAITLMLSFTALSIVAFCVLPLLVLLLLSKVFVPSMVREVFILFFFGLVPALLWLASKNYHTAKQDLVANWKRQLFFAFIIILPLVFAVPVVIGDAGSVLETLAIFIPTTFLLLARPLRRTGWISLIALTILFVGSTVVYKNLLSLIPILPGESEVRLLVFREGPETLSRVLFADTTGKGDISLRKLRDAYQHTWEDQAMVYEGQWTGLGYGNAPTRLSQVRQDTLQYDSLYSFFIASEHGFVGSLSLIILYAAPLILILLSGWRARFDYGRAAAAVIVSAFWLEAIFHAGMNVGAFPLTGRNMPLASINSLTDLLRWLLLFAFAAQAVLWRFAFKPNEDTSEGFDEAKEIREAEFLPEIKGSTKEEKPDEDKALLPSRPKAIGLYLIAVAIVMSVPLLMLARAVWMDFKIIHSSDYQNPFEWKGVLARVDAMITDGLITVDPQTGKVNPNFGFNVPNGALVQQEILRFNALSLDEKLEGESDKDFETNMKNVKSVAEFNKLLDDLRREEIIEQRATRPSLFRLLPPLKWYNGAKVETRGGFRLTTNPAFNSQLNFRAGSNPQNFPRVTFRDGQKVLIGPAWVSGKWVTTFDPDVRVSWLKLLGRAMDAEWKRLKPEEAQKHYGTLSLDDPLHLAAIKFTADKGREAFNNMFEKKEGEAAKQKEKDTNEENELPLPPRVALTVLNFNGEVLALGGYPRMTAGNEWRGDMKDSWLPSSEWVEQEAPRSLRSLFGGDRNFDRMVVGSASKPMWAEAVLSVHDVIDKKLAVNGPKGYEHEVFAIDIKGDPWEVSESKWTNFTQFLSNSDNRYQVRLGFLGLAVPDGFDIQDDGRSPSTSESMNGGKSVWGKYPKFQATNVFSKNKPRSMTGLADTALARNLERMFAIAVGQKKYGDRYSFWTKNETDDRDSGDKSVGQKGQASATRLFAAISPERANLYLNEIEDPRNYVTLLLGGGSNRWANVDLAAAFGTCLTGKPLVAHIVKNDIPFDYFDNKDDSESRKPFNAIAAKVRPGLEQVVENGTAAEKLKEVGAMSYLSFLKNKGYRLYAKTGTLHSTGTRDMSRIIFAVVKWKNESKSEVEAGLIFSLVSERADTGAATKWLGEFLNSYQKDVNRLLGIK
jgi:cell division protein FtsW (lipid II flippase)